jgi:hypothetical protein
LVSDLSTHRGPYIIRQDIVCASQVEEERLAQRPVTHLVLVVHGVGQRLEMVGSCLGPFFRHIFCLFTTRLVPLIDTSSANRARSGAATRAGG